MISPRTRVAVAAAAASSLLLAGCSSVDGAKPTASPASRVHPKAEGSLGPGFWDPSNPPGPEETITPSPDSWTGVHPAPGYKVSLVVDGVRSSLSAGTATLRTAVWTWAEADSVALTEVVANKAADYLTSLQKAIESGPDLVIVVGNGLVDPLAMVSAPNLETQFLIVGAEIAEPTENVTAADWQGAMFRGEGLGLPDSFDPKSFTPERAADAVAAGTAAVLEGITGIVVWVS